HLCEVNITRVRNSIVRLGARDNNLAFGVAQTDRVMFFEPRYPKFVLQVKRIIGMAQVRLSSGDLAIINVPGKAGPERFSVDRIFCKKFTFRGHYHNHVQSGIDHHHLTSRSYRDMMQIIEPGMSYITYLPERRDSINDYLS